MKKSGWPRRRRPRRRRRTRSRSTVRPTCRGSSRWPLAVPPSNDVDVLAHDLGLIAMVEAGGLAGFDVAVGGGMGMTHGEPATYPNLGRVIGFCQPEQVLDVAEQVLAVQRDFGDRGNRKHARLKYTIHDRGMDWFQGELQQRLGWRLLPARPYTFEHRGDRYGWVEGADGKWHLTLYVADGRIARPRGLSAAQRAAADRPGARRRFPPHGQPEPDRRRRGRRGPATDRPARRPVQAQRRPARVGAAAQRHGLRGPADLRAGHGRVGTISSDACWEESRPCWPRPDWARRKSSSA